MNKNLSLKNNCPGCSLGEAETLKRPVTFNFEETDYTDESQILEKKWNP